MRSVVVVLPASMCAMMPMLRTLFRSVSTSCATGLFPARCSCRPLRDQCYLCCQPALEEPTHSGNAGAAQYVPPGVDSPAVVRERLVGFGHLVSVLATL